MITATDDGYAHTHDDAQALIRYAVPGARVRFWQPATTRGRSMSYEITVERWGAKVAPVLGAYTLPAPASQIADHARSQCARFTNEKA